MVYSIECPKCFKTNRYSTKEEDCTVRCEDDEVAVIVYHWRCKSCKIATVKVLSGKIVRKR